MKPPKSPPLSPAERRVFKRIEAEMRARGLWKTTKKRRAELAACFLVATIETFGDLARLPAHGRDELAAATRSGHRACREMLAALGLIDRSRIWPPPAPGEADPDLRAFTEAPQ